MFTRALFGTRILFRADMGGTVAWIYERTKRWRWAWLLLTLTLSALSLWQASHLRFTSDLFDALPKDEAIQQYRSLLTSAGSAGKIIVGFTAPDPAHFDSAVASADRFVEAIVHDSDIVSSAFCRPDPAMAEEMMGHILDHLPLYADDAALIVLANMDSTAVDSAIGDVREQLMRPMSMVQEPQLLNDPFGLTRARLIGFASAGDRAGATVINGVLASSDSTTVFVLVAPTDAARSKQASIVVDSIARAMARTSATNIRAAQFGALPMTVVNAARIKADGTLTMIIAVAFIIVILGVRYRRVSVPLLFLVPPLLGFVFALGMLALVRDEVSGIALGAAASLLGITLDYSFHFFTHLQHRRDIAATLREIASPLLLGCLTTVLAFVGLAFLGAQVLSDLGLLAAFMLVGGMFSVLFLLPHLAVIPAERPTRASSAGGEMRTRAASIAKRWALPLIAIITLALLPFVNKVRFENDPDKMSWMPPEMRALRDKLQGTAATLHTVFIVGSGANEEEAKVALERAQAALTPIDAGARAMFPTDADPSFHVLEDRASRWRSLIDPVHAASLARWIEHAALAHGFQPDAFAGFTAQLMKAPNAHDAVGAPEVLRDLFGGVVMKDNGRTSMAALLRATDAEVRAVETTLADVPDVRLLHRGLLGQRLMALAGKGLGRILLFTSLLVFVVMLIHYGRIELTLLSFIPMALGWLWILGFCGLTGITFNMVNIIVCTFIFGLGDDYCIFTSEGLLDRYRTGADHVGSFRSAVMLSAFTTIICTGVLVFAQHPALRSLALIAPLGMVALLVISLTAQPALFRFFVSDRTAKGFHPFTLVSFCISVFAFLYFLVGCVLLLITYVVLRALPGLRKTKKFIVHRLLMLFTRSLVYVMINVRKDIRSFRAVVKHRPSIIIANHSSFVDILCMLMVTPKVVMMSNRWVWHSPFFGAVVRYVGFLRAEDEVTVNLERAREALAEGYSIIIFPEGTRSRDGRIGRFHKGPFLLAEQLKVPIVPVVLHGIGYAMSKDDFLLKNSRITMRTLPVIEHDDPRFGSTYSERTKLITAWFREQYAVIRNERETPRWFNEQLQRTFLYKGPVLEWYTRIKSKLDEQLHELIHSRIPLDARIVDLGCGHGMLPYLLHFTGPARSILGVDHDAEKISIADHGFSKGANLRFAVEDLDRYEPPTADVFILKDVLHYLEIDRQGAVIQRCARALAPGGSIFVRDGFTGDAQKHGRTRLTEFFSTRLGFNRAKQPLHFISREAMERMASDNGLQAEWTMDNTVTSNELVILKKRA